MRIFIVGLISAVLLGVMSVPANATEGYHTWCVRPDSGLDVQICNTASIARSDRDGYYNINRLHTFMKGDLDTLEKYSALVVHDQTLNGKYGRVLWRSPDFSFSNYNASRVVLVNRNFSGRYGMIHMNYLLRDNFGPDTRGTIFIKLVR